MTARKTRFGSYSESEEEEGILEWLWITDVLNETLVYQLQPNVCCRVRMERFFNIQSTASEAVPASEQAQSISKR
jgi:hypothetical protein